MLVIIVSYWVIVHSSLLVHELVLIILGLLLGVFLLFGVLFGFVLGAMVLGMSLGGSFSTMLVESDDGVVESLYFIVSMYVIIRKA